MPEIAYAAEKNLIRELNLHTVSFVMLSYILSILDRELPVQLRASPVTLVPNWAECALHDREVHVGNT